MDEQMLLLVLGSGLAFVFAVLLWKLLICALGIATTQWAVITGLPDEPVAQLLALGIPALLAAFALVYLPSIAARGAARPASRSVRFRMKGAHR